MAPPPQNIHTARIDTVSIFKFQVIFHDIPGQIAAYAAMINIVNNIIFKIFDIIEFLTYINQKFWISKGIEGSCPDLAQKKPDKDYSFSYSHSQHLLFTNKLKSYYHKFPYLFENYIR